MIWSKGFINSYSTSEFIEFVGITRDYFGSGVLSIPLFQPSINKRSELSSPNKALGLFFLEDV